MAVSKPLIFQAIVFFISELFATCFFICIGCMSFVFSVGINEQVLTLQGICFGLTAMCCFNVFFHISGCHMNPVVTLAAMFMRKVEWYHGLVYIVAQFLGAISGILILKLITPAFIFYNELDNFCLCHTVTFVEEYYGKDVAIESIATAALVLMYCSIWDDFHNVRLESVSLRMGGAITGLTLSFFIYTGASMNPARSFATSLIHSNWKRHWVYWVGPIVGGVVAAVIAKFVLKVSIIENIKAEEATRIETVN